MEIQANPAPPTRPEFAMILAGNLIPLLGVMVWGWNVFELMFLYWIENVVIGVFMILTMLIVGARGGIHDLIPAIFMGAFFTFHYGMFCMGHGVFVLSLFYPGGMPADMASGLFAPIDFIRTTELWRGFGWALGGILIVQAVQLAHNWTALRQENLGRIMMSPYARIIILHITLIFGGMLVMALQTPVAGLVFLIVLKTAFDLGLVQFMKKKKKRQTDETGRNLNT